MITFAAYGGSAYWFLTRGTGAVALVLLTCVVLLGVVEVSRFSSETWPRFLIDSVHRRLAMLTVAFLCIHILTAVLDSFAPIGILDAVIPFHSAYRPLWLGFGAVAFDLLLAIVITSLLRARVGHGTWRAIHWFAYASWPVAVLHGFGAGSDVKQGWMLLIDVICVLSVLVAVIARVLTTPGITSTARTLTLAGSVAFVLGLAIWLPGGPLGTGWAAKAGTPTTLIHGASSATSTASVNSR